MNEQKTICVLMPVYNDWESFEILLENLSSVEQNLYRQFKVVVVNDGSSEDSPESFSAPFPITIINLKINIGHQRAIAAGLQYVHNEVSDCDYIIVMDSDGEDRPQDIKALLERSMQVPNRIIFAERNKRQESVTFKIGYFFYKGLFKYLTGQKISFGNFSLIPKKLLGKVVHQSNIWNHYSGGIIQSKIAFDKVLLDRGKRYKGVSKMNFNSLVLHGLSSIAVYFDQISMKILKVCIIGIVICFIAVLYIFGEKVFTNYAIPGWASSLILIITGIILQLFSVTLIVLLLQLSTRKNVSSPNPMIYLDFIESKESYPSK